MESSLAVEERERFSARLAKALADADVEQTVAALVVEYNLRADGAAVTPYAVRKWLRGDSIPTQEKVNILARWLGVSATWLRFGDQGAESNQADEAGVAAQATSDRNLLRDFNSLPEGERGLVLDFVDLLGAMSGPKMGKI